jgi:hypothetical protein
MQKRPVERAPKVGHPRPMQVESPTGKRLIISRAHASHEGRDWKDKRHDL